MSGPPPPPPPPSYPPPAYPVYPSGAGFAEPGPAPGVEYVTFWPRFGGYLIDGLMVAAIEMALIVPLFFIPLIQYYEAHPVLPGQSASIPHELRGRLTLLGLFGTVVSALYFGGLVARYGRTLGQRAIGARVVRAEDGGRLPWDRAFVRAGIWWAPGIIGLVPFVGTLAGILANVGLLAVAWDSRKQGWHDKLARSFVVRDAPGYVAACPATIPREAPKVP